MIDLEFVAEFVYTHFQFVSTSGNGTHFLARCLLCGDSKKSQRKRRFNLDWNGGNPIYHCFNCGRSGSFMELYATIKGLTIGEARKELYNWDTATERMMLKLSKRKREKAVKEISFEDHSYVLMNCVNLEDEYQSIRLKGYQDTLKGFVASRAIPESEYPVFLSYEGDYKNRFILPIYDEHGMMVYFQARAMTDDIEPKYKNPTLEKGFVILNKHYFRRDRSIVVAEGLIDAWMVENHQGTSMLGAALQDDFLEELFKLTDKDIIVVFDNPKLDEKGREALRTFMVGARKKNPSKFAKKVKYFVFPNIYSDYKDINNIRTANREENIYQVICANAYSFLKTYRAVKI